MNDLGYLEIFTSPLNPRERNVFMNFGYTTVETLILLKRSFDSPLTDKKSFRIHKIRQKDLEKILMIDHASFDSFWQFDKTAFLNAKNATPYTRLRMIKEGKEIVHIGASKKMDGKIQIQNRLGYKIASIGALHSDGFSGNGYIDVSDAYGQYGWSVIGKVSPGHYQ